MGRQAIQGIFWFLLIVIMITVAAITLNGKMLNQAKEKIDDLKGKKKKSEVKLPDGIKSDGKSWYLEEEPETAYATLALAKEARAAKHGNQTQTNSSTTSHQE